MYLETDMWANGKFTEKSVSRKIGLFSISLEIISICQYGRKVGLHFRVKNQYEIHWKEGHEIDHDLSQSLSLLTCVHHFFFLSWKKSLTLLPSLYVRRLTVMILNFSFDSMCLWKTIAWRFRMHYYTDCLKFIFSNAI